MLVTAAVMGLGALLDHLLNESLGVGFVAAFAALAAAAGLMMLAMCGLVRRRLGESPSSSTIVMLLTVYSLGLAPPLVVLGGLWLDDVAGNDPFFGGKGLLAALLACAGPALELAWRHWHVRSLRRQQDAEGSRRLAELERLANTDALTGLANRRCFEEEATRALTASPPGGAILLIALDRFTPVNDTYGHAAGDRLLQEIARRLMGAVRDGDLVARLGGDEFAVLLRGVDSAAVARATVERIHEALKVPVDIGGAQVQPGASIGLAALDAAVGLEGSLRTADAAMYRAKGQRRRGQDMHARSGRALVPCVPTGRHGASAEEAVELQGNGRPR